MKQAVANRPTETVAGTALGLAVFGFTTQVGLPTMAGAIIGTVLAFGPAFVSSMVDAVRR